MTKIKQIEVYESGSQVAIDNMTGIVEKAVIGQNGSVQYQLISYIPERHLLQVNDFEISAIEGKTKKIKIGFVPTPEVVSKKEVTVLLTEENQFIGTSNSDDIIVNAIILSADEIAERGWVVGEKNEKETKEK